MGTASRVPADPNMSAEVRDFLDDLARGEPAKSADDLPSTARTGQQAFVTDSNAALVAGHGNVVASGGANKVPVYFDGTDWRIG